MSQMVFLGYCGPGMGAPKAGTIRPIFGEKKILRNCFDQ